jgi:DNA polymerase-1
VRLALIDGDLLCYRVSALFDEQIDFGPGGTFRYLDQKAAAKAANAEVNDLADAVKADRVLVCLSDAKANFRKALFGRYKSNRPGEKPPLVYAIRETLSKEWPTLIVPRLEADDVMGLLTVDELVVPGERTFWKGVGYDRVIVSCDKDMRTIPGQLYNPMRSDDGIVEVEELEADRWFFQQVLTGDTVDNYPGCPGIGPKSKHVAAVHAAETAEAMWAAVVAGYASKGLLAEAAIMQARMARILRPGEYDPKTGNIKLWTPPE